LYQTESYVISFADCYTFISMFKLLYTSINTI